MSDTDAQPCYGGEAELFTEFREGRAGVLKLKPQRVSDEMATRSLQDLARLLDQALKLDPVRPGAAVADEEGAVDRREQLCLLQAWHDPPPLRLRLFRH